jgi:hypothetical protein
MFYDIQETCFQKEYQLLLRIIGSLSKLSTDGNIPYLYYRMAENIFCKAFRATNLARSDISIDASKEQYGIGLKTFLYKNGCCVEKIAEFNKQRNLFSSGENNNIKDLIKTISYLRNERITTTVDISGVKISKLLYHCVVRQKENFILYETPMELIDIDKICHIKKTSNNTVYFDDEKNEYCFNISKSTLFKKFYVKKLAEFDVPILNNPYDVLYKLLSYQSKTGVFVEKNQIVEKIILPLYSIKGGIKIVPQKSGLNQWNAGGRERDPNEVYIPIPAWIHRLFPRFFPDRDTPFILKLPDNFTLSAKVCQEGSKALMTNPNTDLGKWLLRKVLRVKEGKLFTYNILEIKGIDSVEISKNAENIYYINFKELGAYEEFKNNYKSDEN